MPRHHVPAGVEPGRHRRVGRSCVDAGGAYGLYRFRTDGTLIAPVELPAGAGRIDDPAYSADGKALVFWAAPPSTWDGGTLHRSGGGGRPERCC